MSLTFASSCLLLGNIQGGCANICPRVNMRMDDSAAQPGKKKAPISRDESVLTNGEPVTQGKSYTDEEVARLKKIRKLRFTSRQYH